MILSFIETSCPFKRSLKVGTVASGSFSSILSAFEMLHDLQEVVTLSQLVLPPLLLGII